MKKIFMVMLLLTSSYFLYAPRQISERERLNTIIYKTGQNLEDPVRFFILYSSIIMQESKYNHNVINYNHDGSYDIGITQLNSKYISHFKKVFGEFDPYYIYDNIRIGANIFKSLLKQFNNESNAIMAYNCGPNAVINNNIPKSTVIYLSRVIKYSSKLHY